MAFLSQNSPKTIPEFTGLQVNTAVQALPVPIIYGAPRCNLNLIYYNGFNVQQQSQGGGKGVLSGGKGGGSTTEYFATLIMALGEGPIGVISIIYQDSAVYVVSDYPSNGAFYFGGSDTQVPWSYVVSNWPADARSYKDTAYYGFSNAQLDSSATVPQIDLVPLGILSGTSPLNNTTLTITTGTYDQAGNPDSFIGEIPLGTCDADPAQVIYDFLTNSRYGAGFPEEFIDTTTLFSSLAAFDSGTGDQAVSTFCQAAGLAWSTVINNVESANSIIERWTKNLNVAPFWNGSKLRFIPYWDSFLDTNPGLAGGGLKYFNPNTSPITNITLDQILQVEGSEDDPITFSRKDPFQVYNTVRLDFKDRTNFFNSNVVEAKDEVHIELYGPRVDNIGTADEFSLMQYANVSAQMQLRRNISIQRNFQFRLSPLWGWLDPMTTLLIPDPTNLSQNISVRVIEVEDQEDDSILITCEEFPVGSQSPTLIPTNPTTPPNQGPTNIPSAPSFPPLVFEPSSGLLAAQDFGVPQVIIGASAGYNGVFGQYYGGCIVWVSLDGVNYEELGQLNGPSCLGVLAAPLPGYSGANPDLVNTAVVDLSQSGLTLASTNIAAAAAFKSLCVVSDTSGYELLSYTTSVMSGADTYDLTSLYRGLYGTTSRTFGTGSQFLSIAIGANFLEENLPASYIGSTFFIKLQTFNSFRNYTEDLGSCVTYEYVANGTTPGFQPPPMKLPRHGKRPVKLISSHRKPLFRR